MFSPYGAEISIPVQDGRYRDAIWIFETATGKSRAAVRFPEPFRIFFRASWVKDGASSLTDIATSRISCCLIASGLILKSGANQLPSSGKSVGH